MSSSTAPSLQARIEKLGGRVLARLPDSVVRRLAGKPLVIDDRTLEPRLQIAAKASRRKPHVTDLSVEVARTSTNQALAQGNGPRAPGVTSEDQIMLPAQLCNRLYRPAGAASGDPERAGMLFMHQGGFVLGDLDSCDTFCSRVAAELDMIVISLEYRLAPEHRYPSQRDDADAAWAWLQTEAKALGIDPHRIVVCGDSAGGQMSALLCQRIRDAGGEQPAGQILIYPLVDASAEGGSIDSCADAFPLDRKTMDWFKGHYQTDDLDHASAAVSPLRGEFHDLAPAIVVTAGFDPLRDQGIAYAAALRDAGCSVVERCEDSLSHSFLSMGGVVPAAYAAQGRIISDLRGLLDAGN